MLNDIFCCPENGLTFTGDITGITRPLDREMDILREAGEMITLPHWVPEDAAELEPGFRAFEKYLQGRHRRGSNRPPAMVTIARSCGDGFLPMRYSVMVERRVLEILKAVYGLELNTLYADELIF